MKTEINTRTSTKAEVARVLSWLLTEPDQEMVSALETGEVYRLFSHYFNSAKGEPPSLEGVLPLKSGEDLLSQMREEYRRLFQDFESKDAWWIESVHKPWTRDPECRMVIARETGYLMGDSALHMRGLYRTLGIDVPERFKGLPDHIVLELEFLALLFESSSEEAARIFLRDHLDWVPDLVRRGKTYQPSLFYLSIFEVLEKFVGLEKMETGKGVYACA